MKSSGTFVIFVALEPKLHKCVHNWPGVVREPLPERVQNRGGSCAMRADSRYFWTLRFEPPQIVVQSSPPHDSTRICQNELDLARFLQGSRARIKYNLQLPTPWFKAMALGKHVLSGLGCSRCGSLNGKLLSFCVSGFVSNRAPEIYSKQVVYCFLVP